MAFLDYFLWRNQLHDSSVRMIQCGTFHLPRFTCQIGFKSPCSWERGILAVPYVQPLTTNTNNIAEVEQKQRRWSYLCMCCQSLWGVEVTKAIASPERGAEAIIQGSMVVCSKWPWFNGLQELFKGYPDTNEMRKKRNMPREHEVRNVAALGECRHQNNYGSYTHRGWIKFTCTSDVHNGV